MYEARITGFHRPGQWVEIGEHVSDFAAKAEAYLRAGDAGHDIALDELKIRIKPNE